MWDDINVVWAPEITRRPTPAQTVPDLTQHFTFRKVWSKSQFGMHVVSCVFICKAVRLKQVNLSGGTGPPRRLCCRPSVFFRHLRLIALSLPHGKIWWGLQRCYYLIFQLLNNGFSLRLCNLKLRRSGRVYAHAFFLFRSFFLFFFFLSHTHTYKVRPKRCKTTVIKHR